MIFIKRIIVFLLIFGIVFSVNVSASADKKGFTTEVMEKAKAEKFVQNVGLTRLSTEPESKAIQCFDVNENGLFAIGQESGNFKEIIVYSVNSDFLYGYRFNCNQSFYIEWIEDKINIYFVRSAVLMTVNAEGNIIETVNVVNSSENNSYVNNVLALTERTVGDTKYVVKNDMGIMNAFASSYSQLVKITAEGEESVLYDVNSAQAVKYYLTTAIISILVIGAIIYLYVNIKKGTWLQGKKEA